eukprot:TRINITY_DN2362_c0_g2_i19.p1 TRINITY_DN2362_c0_g2~~TRINITY_DN2362_c0_g2_i19.p1  ORF type:complete len:112 (-),score=9.94 TRINITY_DN2362_c0_g2_i19:91-426(-)
MVSLLEAVIWSYPIIVTESCIIWSGRIPIPFLLWVNRHLINHLRTNQIWMKSLTCALFVNPFSTLVRVVNEEVEESLIRCQIFFFGKVSPKSFELSKKNSFGKNAARNKTY